MTALLPGDLSLSRQQSARAWRYVALYRERFGRVPTAVPEVVVEDATDCEEHT